MLLTRTHLQGYNASNATAFPKNDRSDSVIGLKGTYSP